MHDLLKRSLMMLGAVLCSGCAGNTMSISGAVLTSGAAVQSGKRSPVHLFSHDDYVMQLTDFKWSDPNADGGVHRVSFDWFKDDHLVSKTPVKYIHFDNSPYTTWTRRAAATLGTGRFKVETIVDDTVVSTSTFDIAS